MPESKGRPKKSTPRPQKVDKTLEPSPRWWAPTMVTLMVFGLVWVIVFYVSQTEYPIKALGNWNLLVGFVFMLAGFLMTTRWR